MNQLTQIFKDYTVFGNHAGTLHHMLVQAIIILASYEIVDLFEIHGFVLNMLVFLVSFLLLHFVYALIWSLRGGKKNEWPL